MTTFHPDTKERMMQKIQQGEIKKKPRWYFSVLTSFYILGIAFLILSALYIASFALFIARTAGFFYLPMLGFHSSLYSVLSAPWILLVIAISFIVALELLYRKFGYGYRKTLLYSVITIVIFIFVVGYAISRTPLHQHAAEMLEAGHIDFIVELYQSYGEEFPDLIHQGEVVAITDTTYSVVTTFGENLLVVTNANTRFLSKAPVIGDKVGIIGDYHGDMVVALAIRVVASEDEYIFPLNQ